MRRLKALGAALAVAGLAMFPAVGAMFELGDGLNAIDRLHRSQEGPPVTETIGTYEVDLATNEASIRLHRVVVRR